jgi:acyl carrier protein
MTRSDVEAVVMKHLRRIVDGLDSVEVDTDRSMKDYGANSLDIVEVVSATMREIKVKVPRGELNKISTLGGLVDLLWTMAQQKAAETKIPAHP